MQKAARVHYPRRCCQNRHGAEHSENPGKLLFIARVCLLTIQKRTRVFFVRFRVFSNHRNRYCSRSRYSSRRTARNS